MKSYPSSSLKETRHIVKTTLWPLLLKKVLRQPQDKTTTGLKTSLILSLGGDLGSGKTTLTRSLLRELGVKGRITSPTFTLIRHYRLSKTAPFTDAYHIDCYRLKKPEELLMLGFEEIIKNPKHLVIIEWPDLMRKYFPKKNTIELFLEHGRTKNERVIKI